MNPMITITVTEMIKIIAALRDSLSITRRCRRDDRIPVKAPPDASLAQIAMTVSRELPDLALRSEL